MEAATGASWRQLATILFVILSTASQSSSQSLVKKQSEPTSSNKPSMVLFPGQLRPVQQEQNHERLNLNEADEEGIYLLGLFDIHQSNARVPFKCGPIDVDVGEWHSRRPMQNMEAFLWAIDQINADKSLLPGIKLGALTMDTCSSFLRTNQQLANLLHGGQSPGGNLNSSRQIAALVADNSDWQSVEAVVSMASAAGVTTFVSQSRSSKLGELGRRYTNEERPRNNSAFDQQDHLLHQQQRLYMVRMLLGNELLAEALVGLLQHMSWDLVSLVYDDEPDLVDLHDELAKQLMARNIQLATDEQLPPAASAEVYDRLLQDLAKRSESMGAHVVISLLGTGSARLLLEAMGQLRVTSEPSLRSQLSSLLWLTISDREPYYAMATDALGSVLVSSSASLLPEFKAHYDSLGMEANSQQNRWWPEYMKSVLLRNKPTLELTANECAKWSEPRGSPINEKCHQLSLSRLLQLELEMQRKPRDKEKQSSRQRAAKMAKYLAGGWEHNGMDVINSVLAAANGLESLRQTLCPGLSSGLCSQMRELLQPNDQRPSLSELIHQELARSTFQLADGRMFNLDESNQLVGQVDGKLKFYNLRYVQPNSIGFVKFGQYSQMEGLELNVSKAFHYPVAAAMDNPAHELFNRREPIESIRSSCSDASKCLILGAEYLPTSTHSESQQGSGKQINGTIAASVSNSGKQTNNAISEEELAASLNSLFKLEHPAFSGTGRERQSIDGGSQNPGKWPAPNTDNKGPSIGSGHRQLPDDPLVQAMRSLPAIGQLNWTSQLESQPNNERPSSADKMDNRETFNVIVLLPLHYGQQEPGSGRPRCTETIDLRHSFQLLVAVAFGQQAANNPDERLGDHHAMVNKLEADGQASASNGRQLSPRQLTTTVIDYCYQHELAAAKLKAELALDRSETLGKTIAVLDFDPALADKLADQLADRRLIQLSVGPALLRQHQPAPVSGHGPQLADQSPRIHITPDKGDEIRALVELIGSSSASWRLVHLIYTDSHLLRDEFVRQANLAGICVSKMIWVPAASDVDATRDLFASNLYKFSVKDEAPNSLAIDKSQGLEATRIIVMLASSTEATNRLILEAATESMLEDYIWITSHEWLSSVEQPAELDDSAQQVRLPSHLLSTKLEPIESRGFSQFYSSLTPALHSPLPTAWFDQFWQQHFRCRLPISGTNGSLPICNLNLRLGAEELTEDEHVHYAIEAMEALTDAINQEDNSSSSLVQRIRASLDKQRQSSSGGRLYSIVHRLHPRASSIPMAGRRANSRNLNAAETRGRLIRVASWKPCCGLNRHTHSNGSWYKATEDTDNGELSLVQLSLDQLHGIKSQCSNRETCQLCSAQVSQTKGRELVMREGHSRPHAISSIVQEFIESGARPKFVDRAPGRQDSAAQNLGTEEPMEAAASSLIDGSSINQLGQSHPTPSQTMSKSSSGRWSVSYTDTCGQRESDLNPRRMTGKLVVLSSLAGFSCVLLVTVCLLRQSTRHLKQQQIDEDDSLSLASKSSLPDPRRGQSMEYPDDYFLVAGLLMLFSINFAFLLPATAGVCWFRRVALATTYTLIFSSILVKVLLSRRQWRVRANESGQVRGTDLPSGRITPGPADHIDEGVEVTFESLTHEDGPASYSSNIAARDPEPEPNPDPTVGSRQTTSHTATMDQSWNSFMDPARNPLALPTCLVLGQLAVSLQWFLMQPPEPTLYLGCWHCASPMRSPNMFLYGSLLSLLYPAVVLLFAWRTSVIAFRLASRGEERFRKALIGLSRQTSGIGGHLDGSGRRTQRQLDRRLRDSKLLVLTTTSIVILWSIITLTTISNNRRHPVMSHHPISEAFANHRSSQSPDDLYLVIGNLASGSIIFILMFVSRLRIFPLRSVVGCCTKTNPSSRGLLADAALRIKGQRNTVLKFNQSPQIDGDKWFNDSSQTLRGQSASQSSFFAGNGGHERLRLQQFSSYGTYSSEPTIRDGNYHTSTTINPLHTFGNRMQLDGDTSTGIHLKSGAHRRASPVSLFFAGAYKKRSIGKTRGSMANGNKLQRRQSANSVASSVASSTARLVVADNRSIQNPDDDDDVFDTISCASSVASSSTSQLQGNDLYPIDCSMQPFEAPIQLPTDGRGDEPEPSTQSEDQQPCNKQLSRRSPARRSILGASKAAASKLGSVSEEQTPGANTN